VQTAVWVAGSTGGVLAVASVLLPYTVHLTRPSIVMFGTGLVVMGCGLVLVRRGAPGPAPWLTFAAGAAWFTPALAVSGHSALDTALRCTALLHLALVTHAILSVGSSRLQGTVERGVMAVGYATALTAVVGGFRIALPALGLALAMAVLATGGRLPAPVRRLRAAAGLVLGVGLVLDAIARWWSESAERWIVLSHPAEFAAAAVLVTAAGTRRRSFDVVTLTSDPGRWLASVLEHELGVGSLGIAIADGPSRWITPDGLPREAPTRPGVPVYDAGSVAGVIDTEAQAQLDEAVVEVFCLAAANARLRRSVSQQVEELEASRRRLLTAADSERAALAAQLRARIISRVGAVERDLAALPGLHIASERAATTRRALESIAIGFDPLAPDGTLRQALERLASEAPCAVTVTHCDEPGSRETRLALWYCCAEATSNTTKHAAGSAVAIDIRRLGGRMTARVSDDGPGGADPGGHGLRGLGDRVETLGGTLTVTSEDRAGTTLVIDLPDPPAEQREDWGHPLSETPGDRDALPAAATYRQGHLMQGGPS
jgi:hypothetical protein